MIPLVDLKRQYLSIQKDVERAIQNVLSKTDFILGEDVHAFEKEFSQYCGVRYAIGVDSGTSALELAFHALGIGAGDEVIVPVFTFYASASTIATGGAKPVFAEVEEDTANIDPDKIESLITKKTKAILPVHLFGQPVHIAKISAIAVQHKLHLIEDAAQAHGAEIKMQNGEWKKVGSFGEMACFSFYPGKNLGAYGDGGMVVTNSEDLNYQLRLLRDCGRTEKYKHDVLAYNCRLDTLQAAVLRVKLKKLESWNELRRSNSNLYDKLFNAIGIKTIKIKDFALPVRHVYAIRVKKRDELAQYLKENGVASGVHYPIPLHLQKAFSPLGYKKGDFPVAEKISEEILSLPIFPELQSAEIERIADLIKKFYD